jgi:hypothetical protein
MRSKRAGCSTGIAARGRKRCYQSFINHVLGHSDQRYAASESLECAQRPFWATNNYVWRSTYQSTCEFVETLITSFKSIRKNSDIFAFDKAIETQLVKHGEHRRCLSPRWQQEAETVRAAGLLRARQIGPRRHSAEKRNEFAPVQLIEWHSIA